MKCVIIDIDEISVKILEYYISKEENLVLTYKFTTIEDFLLTPDAGTNTLLFIDIQVLENHSIDSFFGRLNFRYVIIVSKYPAEYIDDLMTNSNSRKNYHYRFIRKPISQTFFNAEIEKLL